MKTTELIKSLNWYTGIHVAVYRDEIRIYNTTQPTVPYLYGFHKDATCTYETLNRISPSMQGLSLDTLVDMRTYIDKYLATPIEDREDTPLYYVKLPSGHYMRNLSDGTIGWNLDIQLAQAYTEAELKELNELYWTLAMPAFPDFLKNNEEG